MLEPRAVAAVGSPNPDRMVVRRLGLVTFRSYVALDVEFTDGPQVVVGPNAAGKTNLARGPGRARDRPLSPRRPGRRAHRVGSRFRAARGRRRYRFGGTHRARHRAHIGGRRPQASGCQRCRRAGRGALSAALPVVLFAPEDMLLIVGSPSSRRGSIDTLVAQTVPEAAATMANYARALTQRNNLLRAIREGAAAPDELRFWDDVIVDDGSQIVDWRRDALAALAGPLAAAHAEIAPDEAALELTYLSNVVRGRARVDSRRAPPPPRRDCRKGAVERPDTGRAASGRRRRSYRPGETFPGSPRAASSAPPSWPSSWPRSMCSAGAMAGRRCCCSTTSSASWTRSAALTSCGESVSCRRHS